MKVLTCLRHNFAIAGMIYRFHGHDPGGKSRNASGDEGDQLGLGAGRTNDHDFTHTSQRVDDAPEELSIDRCMAAADRVGLVMQMHMWFARMNDHSNDIGGIEMKHLGFVVIDPDDRMEMLAHGGLS